MKLKLMIIMAVIIIPGCKKSRNADPVSHDCKVITFKNYENEQPRGIYTYSYNQNGTISQLKSGDNAITYTYAADKINVNINEIKSEITLTDGRATKYTDGGSSYELYSYNPEGYLSKVEFYVADKINTRYELKYTQDNLTTISQLYTNGSGGSESYNLAYSADLNSYGAFMASPPAYFFERLKVIPVQFLGKMSKNMVSKMNKILEYTSNDGVKHKVEDIFVFTFEKDAKGNYVVIDNVNTDRRSENGIVKSTTTKSTKYDFTYDCN
ncbi:hypothetical protein [Pedobacter lusitanus]|nr:hypothetical protein [Pedobacter lusitanus]